MRKRPIIIHFHLFKNAGTSVDSILKKNFTSDWAEIEGPDNKKLDPDDLANFIRNNPDLKAVSSHTAVIKMPEYEDIELIPILFLRHPIDRIRSAYDFERKQDAQTPGAIKAKEGNFEHYMTWRLESRVPWQVMNFHAARLKDFNTFTPAKQTHLFPERCRAALDSFPFVGLVERFDESMLEFQELITPHFEDFEVFSTTQNTTSDPNAKLEDRLQNFKKRIGQTVYDQLCEINALDFQLYHHVRENFDRRS